MRSQMVVMIGSSSGGSTGITVSMKMGGVGGVCGGVGGVCGGVVGGVGGGAPRLAFLGLGGDVRLRLQGIVAVEGFCGGCAHELLTGDGIWMVVCCPICPAVF